MNQSWNPIQTCPQERATHWFRWKDGTIRLGEYEPYWCGSDCPCYDLDQGPDELLSEYPSCWGVKGIDNDPIEWAKHEI